MIPVTVINTPTATVSTFSKVNNILSQICFFQFLSLIYITFLGMKYGASVSNNKRSNGINLATSCVGVADLNVTNGVSPIKRLGNISIHFLADS